MEVLGLNVIPFKKREEAKGEEEMEPQLERIIEILQQDFNEDNLVKVSKILERLLERRKEELNKLQEANLRVEKMLENISAEKNRLKELVPVKPSLGKIGDQWKERNERFKDAAEKQMVL